MQLIVLHVLIVCGGNLGLPQVLFLQRTDHGYCVCAAGQLCSCSCVAVFVVPALSSVLQLVPLHTE